MTFHQWDVVKLRIDPKDRDEHFAVVISPDEVAADAKKPRVNVLYCTSLKPADTVGTHEVRLNGAEGLERASVASCLHFYTIGKDKVTSVAGRVGVERRRQIARKIVACYRLAV
jgi:mRNA-degrading endonuclease toxin of MazEF toxin-antitoxin module